MLEWEQCGAQDAGVPRGSKRGASDLQWNYGHTGCVTLIDEVVSKYKRQEIAAMDALEQIKCIVDAVPPSDDEDAASFAHHIILPPEEVLSWAKVRMHPPSTTSQPASAISPEATAGATVGHGSGLL